MKWKTKRYSFTEEEHDQKHKWKTKQMGQIENTYQGVWLRLNRIISVITVNVSELQIQLHNRNRHIGLASGTHFILPATETF